MIIKQIKFGGEDKEIVANAPIFPPTSENFKFHLLGNRSIYQVECNSVDELSQLVTAAHNHLVKQTRPKTISTEELLGNQGIDVPCESH